MIDDIKRNRKDYNNNLCNGNKEYNYIRDYNRDYNKKYYKDYSYNINHNNISNDYCYSVNNNGNDLNVKIVKEKINLMIYKRILVIVMKDVNL